MIIETTIDRPAAGGEFIALYDGRIVLVRGGLPGERVRVTIEDPAARLWRGHVVEVLDSAPGRIEQPCEAARAGVGCCDWGYISPEVAAGLKADIVADCLRRLGHFDVDALPEIKAVALNPALRWRTRVRLGVDKQGRAGLRKAASRELVVGMDCAQAQEGLLAGLGDAGAVPVAAPTGKGRRRLSPGELFVAMDTEGHRSAVHVVGGGKHRRESVIEGAPSTSQTVHAVTFEVPTTGFWQAHAAAPTYYADRVAELTRQYSPTQAWDLYGGSGVLAAGLLTAMNVGNGAAGSGAGGNSDRVDPAVISVESHPASARAGRRAFAGLPVKFVTGDVARVVRKLVSSPRAQVPLPDVVVLDPPRTGAGEEAVRAIASAAPKAVVHIGCDPATFARDARYWADSGYRLASLEAVDAFPMTHHVEVISLWEKASTA
nr:TRAM domain-containing protein [Corynebacterium lactis]